MKKKIIILTSLLLIGLTIFFMFFYNIGLNNRYFIEKDFNEAFLYRVTGDCDRFGYYTHNKEIIENCKKEITKENPQILNWQIMNISINNGIAYLQVKLERDGTYDDRIIDKYAVNYKMIKDGNIWKISK